MPKKRRSLVISAVLLLLAGVGVAYWRSGPSLLPRVRIGGVEGVIVPGAFLDQELHPCSRSAPPGSATPAPVRLGDLYALEQQLPEYVAANPPHDGRPIAVELPTYGRRYSGLLRNGRPAIYVGLVTRDLGGGPDIYRTAQWNICDGGAAAFGVEFDIGRRGFTHIAYNGGI